LSFVYVCLYTCMYVYLCGGRYSTMVIFDTSSHRYCIIIFLLSLITSPQSQGIA
jgi:hypothetical protein